MHSIVKKGESKGDANPDSNLRPFVLTDEAVPTVRTTELNLVDSCCDDIDAQRCASYTVFFLLCKDGIWSVRSCVGRRTTPYAPSYPDPHTISHPIPSHAPTPPLPTPTRFTRIGVSGRVGSKSGGMGWCVWGRGGTGLGRVGHPIP